MQQILTAVSDECRKLDAPCVFVLIGKEAWKFEACLDAEQSSCIRVLTVSHPVARKETVTPWMGSCIFSRVSNMMIDMGMVPVKWV